ncbi:hypothetical protein BDW69DRAFT_11059 [Aspergillus filifer]
MGITHWPGTFRDAALREPTCSAAYYWSYGDVFSLDNNPMKASKIIHDSMLLTPPGPLGQPRVEFVPWSRFSGTPGPSALSVLIQGQEGWTRKGRSVPEVDRRKMADRLRYDSQVCNHRVTDAPGLIAGRHGPCQSIIPQLKFCTCITIGLLVSSLPFHPYPRKFRLDEVGGRAVGRRLDLLTAAAGLHPMFLERRLGETAPFRVLWIDHSRSRKFQQPA